MANLRRKATTETMIAMARAGVRTSAIATTLGVTTANVSVNLATARKAGVDVPIVPRARAITSPLTLEAVALAKEGSRPQEIAEKLGVPVHRVRYALKTARAASDAGLDVPAFRPGQHSREAARV